MVIATIIVAVILVFSLFSFAMVVEEETIKIFKDDTTIMKIAKLYATIIMLLIGIAGILIIANMIVRTIVDSGCEFNNGDMKICQEVINK